MASKSETAKLLALLELKDKFSPALKKADRSLSKFDAHIDRTQSRAHQAGQQIGTGIKRGAVLAAAGVGLVAFQVQQGLDSLIELEKQTAQTNAVIKSTGGVAGITADEVGRLAEKYEGLNATVGDEVIREGENLLLTFTNIRKDAFEPALAIALDMNQALGKGPDGLTNTVRVLGKALNDPTKGLGALSRVGITFDKAQTKRIKQLQKEGDLYGAQSIIIGELEKRFGGSFLAGGGTTAGKVAKFTDAVEDAQRALAEGMLPVVGNVADALTELLADPEIKTGINEFGDALGELFSKDNVKTGAKVIGDVVKSVAAAAPTIGAGLSTAATAIGAVISAFQKLPPEVQQLAIGAVAVNKLTGGLLTNVAGGIFGALKTMTVQAGVVNVTGATAGSLGGLGKGAAAGAGIGLGAAVAGGGLVAAFQLGITEAFNDLFKDRGIDSNIKPAGAYDIPGQLHNIAEALRLLGEVNKKPARDPNISDPRDVRTEEELKRHRSILTSVEANVLRVGERQKSALDQTKERVAQKVQETTRETTRGAQQTQATQRSTAASLAVSQAVAASRIVSAIFAARPVISVTNVTRTYNRTTNYGPPSGSRSEGTGNNTSGPVHR